MAFALRMLIALLLAVVSDDETRLVAAPEA